MCVRTTSNLSLELDAGFCNFLDQLLLKKMGFPIHFEGVNISETLQNSPEILIMKTKHVSQDNMHGNLPCLSFRNDSIYKVSVICMFPYGYPSTHIKTPHMYCCVLEQSNSCLNHSLPIIANLESTKNAIVNILNLFYSADIPSLVP